MVTPASSVTYTATATGPGGTATDTVRVTVNVPAPPPAAAPPPPPAPAPTLDELFGRAIQDILFDYDKSDIRPDQTGRIQGNATFLRQQGAVRITIEGHADERGSQEYNLGLGDRRANAAKSSLVQQGIAENRINTITFGEERPVCREQSEDCYQRNRRAHFVRNPN
jgi:peptidoglycan-associated lipoprotein